MDEHRWVVDKVRTAIELPGDEESITHPSLVRTSTGDLLLFGSAYAGSRFKAKDLGIMTAGSRDDGETWSAPRQMSAEGLPGGKPLGGLEWGGTYLESGRIVLQSTSFGADEPPPKPTVRSTGEMSPYGFPVFEVRGRHPSVGQCRVLLSDDDAQSWHVSDRIDILDFATGGGITQIPDGSLILPVYGYRRGTAECEQCSTGFVRSWDEGETWSEPTIVAPWDADLQDLPSEMGIVVLPDGRWVALYRNQFQREDHNSTDIFVYRSYSHDRGKTWTVGHQVFPDMGYTGARLLPDGALMVMGHSYQGLLYAVSNDGGETWDYQNVLWGWDARSGGDCGGFSIVDLEDGRVLVAYYARADRSGRFKSPYEYGKMRFEVAWLKRVRADSTEGRMR